MIFLFNDVLKKDKKPRNLIAYFFKNILFLINLSHIRTSSNIILQYLLNFC